MLDLDDFKAFNDSFGHLKGDEALALLGQEISNIIRKKDIAARYGGEEFVVALPQTGYPQAKKAAERIRARIDQLDFGVPEKLTASIGIAVSPLDGTSFTQLLAQADKAMYYAKEQGKNRVCTAKEIPEE
jgi:two-component system cell cycle response regulator